MPPLPPAGPVVRITLIGSQGPDLDVVTRFFLGYSGPAPTAAQLVTYLGVVNGAWNSDLSGVANDNYSLTLLDAEDLSSSSGAVGSLTSTHAGTMTGTLLPASNCTLVNFKVARRYRGGKPRVYLPAPTAASLSSQQVWTNTYVGNVTSGWNSFITACLASPWTGATLSGQVNVSYYEGFLSVQNPVTLRWRNIAKPRTTPVVDAITAVTTNPKVGSQRRRVNA